MKTAAAAKDLEDMCFDFCGVNATLVLTFHRATPPLALFNCTMKFHYLMHLGLACRYINPLAGSCYQGETLMQLAKKMVKASAGGSSLTHGTNAAMLKYSYALGFDLANCV